MNVITYTLCKDHDAYFLHACAACYLAHLRVLEAVGRQPEYEALGNLAALRATSTPCPMVP